MIMHLSTLQQILPRKILTIALVVSCCAVLSGLLLASTVEAADKRIREPGPYNPNQEVTIEVEFEKPQTENGASAEIILVIDVSDSIGSFFDDFQNKVVTFANKIAQYGTVKVGVQFIENSGSSPTFNTWSSKIITNGNVGSFVNYINSLHLTSYGSDVGNGIQRGVNAFTTNGDIPRYLAVMTDMQLNKGQCFLSATSPSNIQPTISIPSDIHFQLVVGGAEYGYNGDGGINVNFPNIYDYGGGVPYPCDNYYFNVYGGGGSGTGGWPADVADDMVSAYGAVKNSNITTGTFESVEDRIIDSIAVTDSLNPAVFEEVRGLVGVYNCANGAFLFNDPANISYMGYGSLDMSARIHNVNFDGRYCLRFKALIKSNPITEDPDSGGNPQINNCETLVDILSNAVVTYNIYDEAVDGGLELISCGSMDIQNSGDLDVIDFWLTDSAGTRKTQFYSDERIYVHTRIRNIGPGPVTAGADTAFYKHHNTILFNSTPSDIPMYIINHGNWAPGDTRTYNSRGGGLPSNPNSDSWIMSAPGSYEAKMYTNYTLSSPETTPGGGNAYANNKVMAPYTIIERPDLQAINLTLNDAGSDVSKRVFADGERIYLNAWMRNLTGRTVSGPAVTTFHKTQAGTASAGQWTDIPSYISIGSWPANRTYHFISRPGSSTAGSFGSDNYWTAGEDGTDDFVARMHVNYRQDGGPIDETNYSNNQDAIGYSVVTVPQDLAPDSLVCNGVTLRWTPSSSNVTNYSIRYRQGSGSYTTRSNIGNRTSYGISGLAPEANYNWQIAVRTQYGLSDWFDGGSFTTPACPEYTTEVVTPITIIPGDTAINGNGQVNITYLPQPNATQIWNDQEAQLRVAVVGIVAGDSPTACNGFSPSGSPFTGNLDGLSARRTPKSTYPTVAHRTVTAPTSPVNFDITAANNTDSGLYTVCIGMSSPQSFVQAQDSQLKGIVVRVQLRPWIQIDRPDGFTSSKVGDVHSNGKLDIYVPVNEYFFKSGTAGVVSASDNIEHIQSDRLVSAGLNRWRIPQYPPTIQTRTFDGLISLARAAQEDPNEEISGIPSGNLNSICAQGSAAYLYTGDFVRGGELDLSDSPQCSDVNIVFFIDGDVVHNANIIDGTNGATLTFISSGDVTVSPNVTRLDGVHIFTGRFDSGSKYVENGPTVDDQLTVNGSLIGLAGASPNGSTGSFTIDASTSGLHRNLGLNNTTTPAERIVYHPKYLYLLRDLLGTATYSWNE